MPKSDQAPPWLATMRGINGMTETPGSASNPKIVGMAEYVGEKWPEQESYASNYTGDDIAWCGVTIAYCVSTADIRPVFGPTDTDKWMWAEAWSRWPQGQMLAQPRLGCIVVFRWDSGSHHVTLYESTNGSQYMCRGGNQSDMVNLTGFPASDAIALVWPKEGGPVPPAERRELSEGDVGSDVAQVQQLLLIPADGEYGPVTEAAVKAFQKACGMKADGVVGSSTWDALDELESRYEKGDDGISPDMADAIDDVVDNASAVQAISWKDRGQPPDGYYNGMAKTFALACIRYNQGDNGALIMGQKASGNPDKDALTWYAKQLKAAGLNTNKDGLVTLRALFTMMIRSEERRVG